MNRGRSIGRVAVLAALACALALPSAARSAVRESPFVERASAGYRATTSCYDRPDWAALVRGGYPDLRGHETEVYGLWRYEIRQVALPTRGCRALERWRHSPPGIVSVWIFVLGHELTHAKFRRIKLELGITRQLRPPPRDFTRCPLKRAKGPVVG